MEKIETQLKALIQSKYRSMRDFAIKIGLPYTTLDSIFKRGIQNAGISNVITICEALGISTDALAAGKIIEIEKPATDYDDGLKLLDAELAKLMRDLSPEDAELARAFLTRLKTRKK